MGKAKRGKEGQYLPLPYAQLKSEAWRSLSGAAVRVFLELHTRYNGGNNGKLTLSYAEAGEALGMGKATVQRAYRELVEHGFLVLEKEGNWYHRRAHEWRLTTKSVQGVKGKTAPTHDWRSYRAQQKEKRGSGSDPSSVDLVPIENPSGCCGSTAEPVKARRREPVGSDAEHY